jgi:hypothetical protein
MNMKIRKDSPFFGITEDDIDFLIDDARCMSVEDVADKWTHNNPGKDVTTEQMRRFLVRVRRHRLLFSPEVEDAAEALSEYAGHAAEGKARDGVIEAARQRLFEEALEKGDSAALLELYKSANEERAREREVEVERRKAAVAEENAKIGWRAEAALRLWPRLREVLEEGGGSDEAKLARVREVVGIKAVALLEDCKETQSRREPHGAREAETQS